MRKLTTVLALAAVALPLATAGNALATQIAPLPSCAKGSCSVTFPAVGDSYAWTVPTGVTSLSFDIQGAQGASATTSAGTGERHAGSEWGQTPFRTCVPSSGWGLTRMGT